MLLKKVNKVKRTKGEKLKFFEEKGRKIYWEKSRER